MKKTPAIVGLLCACALAGCGPHSPPAPTPPVTPAAAPSLPQTGGNTPPSTSPAVPSPAPVVPRRAVIYTVDMTRGTDANNYLVPHTVSLADDQDPAREAVEALIASPDSPLPRGTRLRSIKIADGMATVDFSRPPVDETHGEEAQAQALEALQYTLGQFSDVSSFQITVRGRLLPAIGEAAGGPMDVIRPGGSPPESAGA